MSSPLVSSWMERRASLDRGLADYRRAQEINADRAEAQVNLRILADRVLRLDQPRPWRSGSYPGLRAHVATDRAGASRDPSALPGTRPRRSLRTDSRGGYCGDGTAAGTHTHCQACVTPSPRSTYFPCGYTTSRWTIVCRYPAGGWAPTAGAGTGC